MLRISLVSLLIAAFLQAAAEEPASPDRHYVSPRVSAIAQRSAFIHGYLHGYETGFHAADIRLYMGGTSFGLPEKVDLKEYREEFGEKERFRSGFRYGQLTGYADALSGRRFRAIETVAEWLGGVAGAAEDGESFDQGIASGYAAGQKRGLADGRSREPFQIGRSECGRSSSFAAEEPQSAASEQTQVSRPEQSEFCNGFRGGYGIGYSDGYTNQEQFQRRAAARK